MAKIYHVYILASGRNGTLYTGVTGALSNRIAQHKSGKGSAFTARYKLTRLVHAEAYDDPATAYARERAIKKWNRAWKLALIEKSNPSWEDLTPDLL